MQDWTPLFTLKSAISHQSSSIGSFSSQAQREDDFHTRRDVKNLFDSG